MRLFVRLGIAVLLALPGVASAANTARNVILIIGDGMDDQQITIARNYLVGSRGRLTLDRMPLRGVSQVLTVSEQGEPVYVADSANSATALATGAVTSRGRIATSAGADKPLTTLLELAEAAGLKTGLVSTASITDATPASFVAHINSRYCESPAAMQDVKYAGIVIGDCRQYLKAAGGPGSIAEQIAASEVDVLLGGGLKHFKVTAEGSPDSVVQQAEKNGYHLVTSADELLSAAPDKKLLGLFSPSTMPVRWQGENARKAEKPVPSWANHISKYLGSVRMPDPMVCEPNPGYGDAPSLKQMTDVALARLGNPQGFFLMIESASIDKQAHDRKPCGSIGELAQLDEALDSALAYAADHRNTLVLVTADHGQTAQIIPDESLLAEYGVPVFSRGRVARIKTPEGGVMNVNYASNDFIMEEHTGVNVPLFANTAGTGLMPTMLEQAQIFKLMRDYLGL